jgi:hypothetical protein
VGGDQIGSQAPVLAESGADLEEAAAGLLGLAGGQPWVAETALARTEALAHRVPGDAKVAQLG